MAYRRLSLVVGGFDALDIDEGPQGLCVFEKLLAGFAGFRFGQSCTLSKQCLESASQPSHVNLKCRTGQGAVTHPMPPSKHPGNLPQHGQTNAFRVTATLGILVTSRLR